MSEHHCRGRALVVVVVEEERKRKRSFSFVFEFVVSRKARRASGRVRARVKWCFLQGVVRFIFFDLLLCRLCCCVLPLLLAGLSAPRRAKKKKKKRKKKFCVFGLHLRDDPKGPDRKVDTI